MQEKQRGEFNRKLLLLCLCGMMTAVCFAGNYARIQIPMSIGGTSAFTLGNITGVLSGLLLGPVGGLASGLGAALYDCTNPAYVMEAPLTFLTKGAMGLVAGWVASRGASHRKKLNQNSAYRWYLLAAILGALTYYVLYFVKVFFYNGIFIENLEPAAALLLLPTKIPTSVVNGVLAAVVAPSLALAIRKALDRSGMELDRLLVGRT